MITRFLAVHLVYKGGWAGKGEENGLMTDKHRFKELDSRQCHDDCLHLEIRAAYLFLTESYARCRLQYYCLHYVIIHVSFDF